VKKVEQTVQRVSINKNEVMTHVAFVVYESLKSSLSNQYLQKCRH
jgi:hypothetical protein